MTCAPNDTAEQCLVLFTKGARARIKPSPGLRKLQQEEVSRSPLCGRFLPDVRGLG